MIACVAFGTWTALAAPVQPGPPDLPAPRDSSAKPGFARILVHRLHLGELTIEFETTKLTELASRFPGLRIHSRGDAGEALAWVCFRVVTKSGAAYVWPDSGELGGRNIIDGAVVAPVANHPEPDCPDLPVAGGQVGFDNGIWIGMASADAYAKLGTPPRKFGSIVTFDFQVPAAGREKACVTGGELALDIQSGRVARIWANKETSC